MGISEVIISSLCLVAVANCQYYSQVQSYQPAYPSYNPQPYYETYDTQVDYKEANQTKRCGVLPVIHSQFGYDKSRVNFGQYPWNVGILDNYYNYLCAGALITPRHVLTSSYCVDKLPEDQLRVRVGEWDLQSDKNYLEVLRNDEITVCKKHPFYSVYEQPSYPQSQYNRPPANQPDQYSNYAVVILELSYDVDFDLLPHVEPLCLPEFYYLTKSYTDTYTGYSYGYGQNVGQNPAPSQNQVKNEEGANKDLTCWVAGYQNSPMEKFESQQQQQSYPQPSYGQSYSPQYPSYYPSYEYSRTPRRAKVHKVEEYASYYPKPSYGAQYKTENWEADYYYDACHADVGAPIFCLVQGQYEDEESRPAYPESYPPSYPSYTPSYPTPSYTPAYPQSYPTPSYSPSYPMYDAPKYKRAAPYTPPYQPSYQPSYPAPSYQPSYPAPSYQPSYPTPSYQPTYPEPEYKAPIKTAEPLNEEYRRAALFGVVQYPPECSYTSAESKKLTATPVEDILPWIKNVIHTPPSCTYSSYSSY